MRVGAHVPTRGSPASAVDYALAAGCEAFQIFGSNPRAWAPPPIRPSDAEAFRRRRTEAGLGPVFVHSSYLVNVASPDEAFRRRSVDLARRELEAAEALEADGIVVHAGSGGPGERAWALERAAASVEAVVAVDGPDVLLELTAGGAGTVASTIPQAAELLEAVGRHPRVMLCLDTCHLFAAGYPLDDPGAVGPALDELRRHRITRRLRLVHANDARDPRGSRRDRHARPGHGAIGERGLRAVLADPAVRRCAVLVETPGDLEAHRGDVAALRRLAGV
ncbi:MAG TPA: deoxyribonuclease IV [Actinomycetota bacterium]|nr:deoxyribonuclease IV [Actinomycetota bacterium]